MSRSSKSGGRKKLFSRLPTKSGIDFSVTLRAEQTTLKESISKLEKKIAGLEERIQELEVHENILTRLLTTLCVEKFGMRIGVLKRFIKRVEKEAIRDSQIYHLESLYQMPDSPAKGGGSSSDKKEPPKKDPWEDIS